MQLKIESSLLSLLNLKKGWHFGEGASISEESVLIAIAITRRMEGNKEIKYIESFPMLNGYVNLQITISTLIIGMIIESEKKMGLLVKWSIDGKEDFSSEAAIRRSIYYY